MKTVVAGTFDQLHVGHKKLLDVASMIAENDRLVVGLMADEAVKNKKHPVRSFLDRKADVWDYLLEKKWLNFSIVEINGVIPSNPEEIIGWDKLEAIVVSEETYEGAQMFNIYRGMYDLNKLIIVVVPPVVSEDGNRVSSTRIHHGECTLEGKLL